MACVAEEPVVDGVEVEQEEDARVVYKLRDRQASLCAAWSEQFGKQPRAAVGEFVEVNINMVDPT